MADADWLVDGLLGTGLTRPLEGVFRLVVEAMNRSGKPILALDLPSGLDADTRASARSGRTCPGHSYVRCPEARLYHPWCCRLHRQGCRDRHRIAPASRFSGFWSTLTLSD